ncbi:MAG: DUF4153 domain-containing protein [Methyloligellaceae bacterium]
MSSSRPGFGGFVRSLAPDIGAAAERFPIAVLAAASITAFLVFDVDDVLGLSDDAVLRVTLGHASAFFWALAVALRAEAADWDPTRRFGITLAGIGVIAGLYAFPRIVALQPFQLCAALAILAGLAPYLARRTGDVGPAFWQYNHQLWLGFGLALVGAGLFAGGLSLIIETLELLFDLDFGPWVHRKVWTVGLGLIAPINWLSLAPRDFGKDVPIGEQTEFTSQAVANIVKFILVPLLLVYTAILYAYAVKIAVDGVLPKGRLGPMVLAYGGLGSLTALLAYPTRGVGGPLVALFWRHWFWLTAVPLVLLFLAAYARIAQYGVTDERYLVVLAGFWLASLAVLFAFKRDDRDIRVLPLSLCLLLGLAAFGPWGTAATSVRSQTSELAALLEKHGRLKAGRIAQVTFDDQLPVADAKRVNSIITYLWRWDRLDAIAPWFVGRPDDPFGADATRLPRPWQIAKLIGVRTSFRSSSGAGSIAYAPDRPARLDVQGFTSLSGPYQFTLSKRRATWDFTIEAPPNREIKLTVSREAVILEDLANGTSDRLPLTKLVQTIQPADGLGPLADGAQATRPGRPPHLFVHQLGDVRVGLFFPHSTGNRDDTGFRYLTGRVWVLIGATP